MNHEILIESELEEEFPYRALLEKVISAALTDAEEDESTGSAENVENSAEATEESE